jgi:hypothetical protein
MGLLSILDRYLPDEQVMSLLNGGRRGVSALLHGGGHQPQGVTTTDNGDVMRHLMAGQGYDVPADATQFGGASVAPPAYDKSTDGKPGFWSVLDGVLGGETISEARDSVRKRELARRAEPANEAIRQRVMNYVSGLPAEQQALYFTNPDKWSEAIAKGYEPRTLSGGQTEHGPNGDYTAPMIGVSGDQAYTQTPSTFTITGKRGPTFDETSQDANRRATVAQALAALDETRRHNKASESVDAGRLSLEERKRRDAAGGDGGDLGGMTTQQLLDAL